MGFLLLGLRLSDGKADLQCDLVVLDLGIGSEIAANLCDLEPGMALDGLAGGSERCANRSFDALGGLSGNFDVLVGVGHADL